MAHELTIIDILADIEFKPGHAFVGAILLIASRLLQRLLSSGVGIRQLPYLRGHRIRESNIALNRGIIQARVPATGGNQKRESEKPDA